MARLGLIKRNRKAVRKHAKNHELTEKSLKPTLRVRRNLEGGYSAQLCFIKEHTGITRALTRGRPAELRIKRGAKRCADGNATTPTRAIAKALQAQARHLLKRK